MARNDLAKLETAIFDCKKLTDFPEFIAAEAKLAEVKDSLGEVEKRIAEINGELAAEYNSTRRHQRANTVKAAAQRMLDSGTTNAAAADIREEFSRLSLDASILRAAVGLQEKEIARVSRLCALKIIESVRPAYAAMAAEALAAARRFCELMVAGKRVHEHLNGFFSEVHPLPQLAPTMFMNAEDGNNPIQYWMKELEESQQLSRAAA